MRSKGLLIEVISTEPVRATKSNDGERSERSITRIRRPGDLEPSPPGLSRNHRGDRGDRFRLPRRAAARLIERAQIARSFGSRPATRSARFAIGRPIFGQTVSRMLASASTIIRDRACRRVLCSRDRPVRPFAPSRGHEARVKTSGSRWPSLARHLCAQRIRTDGRQRAAVPRRVSRFSGHGNVPPRRGARFLRDRLPTLRAHNEQGMALAAIAFAKASRRRRLMACTTSVGPGATNLVTAAAVAHANRLPVLLLPGDTFANRQPDPVLQQIEHFDDPTVTANDCLRPVSRFWDRILRPEQLLACCRRPSPCCSSADCGPATLALPQECRPRLRLPGGVLRRTRARDRTAARDRARLEAAVRRLRGLAPADDRRRGRSQYSGAGAALADFAAGPRFRSRKTQAGKGALAWDHPCNDGAIGVTGSADRKRVARGSRPRARARHAARRFPHRCRRRSATSATGSFHVNVARHDAIKRGGAGASR